MHKFWTEFWRRPRKQSIIMVSITTGTQKTVPNNGFHNNRNQKQSIMVSITTGTQKTVHNNGFHNNRNQENSP